ncbi:MAG: NAD-dependent deacetylase [Bradymonadaceae bacterium]
MSDASDAIERAAELYDRADEVLVFAGSGLSEESGVPTYRGEDGLFSDPDTQDLARAGILDRDPERALSFYQEGRETIRGLDPNPGHRALARLSRRARVTVATQNVDGLLERACADEGVELPVHHLHGSLFEVVCRNCGASPADPETIDLSELPDCDRCGELLRPDVVLFGELLPQDAFDRSVAAAETADLCLLLGTSGIVHPAAGIPREAKAAGAELIEVNPNATELSELCDLVIRETTGEALPAIEERVG